MKHSKVSLYFNELRLKAVQDALAHDGFTIEDKLKEAFDFLYEQLVPYEQQTAIETQIEETEKAEEVEEGVSSDSMHILVLSFIVP